MNFKIKSLTNGWIDKDVIMLHACFQLLVNYVENEGGLTHCNYESHKESIDELQILYDWWIKLDKDKENPEEQEMLERLIKIRGFMWT